MEYQTLFDLNVEIIVKENYEKIKQKTEETIRQLLDLNIYNNKKIIYNKEFEDIIKNIKQNIGNKSKEQWLIFEAVMEKLIKIMKEENFKQKIKNKVGRPKKKYLLSIIKENKKEDENVKEDKKINQKKRKIQFRQQKIEKLI